MTDPETRWLGRPLVRLETVDSTNAEAWRRAEDGAPHGLVVVAREQTSGRGRLDRTWLSPRDGGIYVSALMRPGALGAATALVGVAAAIATAEAAEDAGVARASVKWPNDVWVGDRKMAGILVEARDAGRSDAAVVAGIGLNVAQASFPDELRVPATSLRLEGGRGASPEGVLPLLLRRLEPWIDALLQGRTGAIDAAFAARDVLAGRRISFALSGDRVVGTVRSVSPLEGLVLRLEDGTERRFPPDHVNEVTVEEPAA